MKTVSTLLQIIALLACFAAHQAFSDEMTGVRRAVETTSGKGKPATSSAPAIFFCPMCSGARLPTLPSMGRVAHQYRPILVGGVGCHG